MKTNQSLFKTSKSLTNTNNSLIKSQPISLLVSGNHSQKTQLYLFPSPQTPLVLGLPWLKDHNSQIEGSQTGVPLVTPAASGLQSPVRFFPQADRTPALASPRCLRNTRTWQSHLARSGPFRSIFIALLIALLTCFWGPTS